MSGRQVPIDLIDWLKNHATRDDDGKWKCDKSGEVIRSFTTGRSIWIKPFLGGMGEVRMIQHPYCPSCNPKYQPPPHGTPIYEDELAG